MDGKNSALGHRQGGWPVNKTVVVTQKIIKRAERLRVTHGRTRYCLVALAINAAFKTRNGWAGYFTGGVMRKRITIDFKLPLRAQKVVSGFDNSETVKPV